MKAKILETFRSIQGEGKYAGTAQVFARFFKCNMHCHWCDTPHSIGDTSDRSIEYDVEQLFSEIKTLWNDAHSVSITGGEPLLQADFIKELLVLLNKENMSVHLETNGVLPEELKKVIDGIDVVAMDIKLPSSTKCQSYWEEHKEFIEIAKQKDLFIKTVITVDTDLAEFMKAVEMVAQLDPSILFIIQPNSFDIQNGVVGVCNDFYNQSLKLLNNVRVMPQMHRLMKVR